MKRYLVSMEGRSNLCYSKLRGIELACSYVYANNKKEAISKFWEQFENNKNIGVIRRDVKITAERWEKGELDCNGNPMSDLESAIPFDLLHLVEWQGLSKRYAVPESIMAQDELKEMKSCMIKSLDEMQEDLNKAEAEKASEDAEPVDNRKPSEIIRSSWDWKGAKTQSFMINGKKITTNLCSEWGYWNGCDVPEKYTYRLGGRNYKARKSSSDELDDLVAQGFDEIRFKLYASKMVRCYCEIFVYAGKSETAKELRAKHRAEAEAKKIEEAKAELSKNLSAQLKADAEKKIEREAQKILSQKINPEKNYHVIKASKSTTDQIDLGIWSGKNLDNMKAGFNGFFTEDDEFMYYATEEPENDSTAQEKEIIIQPEPEKATESNSEPHSQPVHHLNGAPRLINTSKRKVISYDEIMRWNQMLESAKGKTSYYTFTLWHEGRDEHGRWFELGHGNIRAHMISHPSDVYYIKKIKDEIWLYFEQCGTVEERWLLSDVARAYFLHESEEGSQELSGGSHDDEKEIIKENAQKSTESNSEAQECITSSMIHLGKYLEIEERKEGEFWSYYSEGDLIWSSAEKFSPDDLSRMYEGGYFMNELKNLRAKLVIEERRLWDNSLFENARILRNRIDLIDDEIARLFINRAEMNRKEAD